MKRKRPSMAAARERVQHLEARVLGKLGISDMEEIMPAVKRLDHEAIVQDRAGGMTYPALAEKYGAAKSTIAWHLRQNGNGNGEAAQEAAATSDVTLFRKISDVTLPDELESPANGKDVAGAESFVPSDLAELEKLLDQHCKLLSLAERVKALLNTYAC
jgi:hypothetical protein